MTMTQDDSSSMNETKEKKKVGGLGWGFSLKSNVAIENYQFT